MTISATCRASGESDRSPQYGIVMLVNELSERFREAIDDLDLYRLTTLSIGQIESRFVANVIADNLVPLLKGSLNAILGVRRDQRLY